MINFLTFLFLMIACHCLADTALQSDFMAKGKNKNRPIDPARVPPGQKPLNLWYMWLTHHAMIQALVLWVLLYFIAKNFYLITAIAFIEFISHWIIDFFKCENKYDPRVDQLLHIGMKVIYISILI